MTDPLLSTSLTITQLRDSSVWTWIKVSIVVSMRTTQGTILHFPVKSAATQWPQTLLFYNESVDWVRLEDMWGDNNKSKVSPTTCKLLWHQARVLCSFGYPRRWIFCSVPQALLCSRHPVPKDVSISFNKACHGCLVLPCAVYLPNECIM